MEEQEPQNHLDRLLSKLRSPTTAPMSASDFVASFQNGYSATGTTEPARHESPSISANPQNALLLQLLQSQSMAPASPSNNVLSPVSATPPLGHLTSSKPSPFTATNPFDQLTKSQPAPLPLQRSRLGTPAVEANSSRPVSTTALGDSESNISQLRGNSQYESHNQSVETVSEAVGEVGEQAERQVEEALAKFQLDEASRQNSMSNGQVTQPVEVEADEEDGESTASASNEWDADKSDIAPYVFTIPMKPFVSLDVVSKETKALPLPIPVGGDIAYIQYIVRSKKDFDQLDRNLVACTPQHIVYALKEKGIRIVDVYKGDYEDKFHGKFGDHVHSVLASVTSSDSGSEDNVIAIATGAKGELFWTKIETVARTVKTSAFAFAPHVAEQDAAGPNSGLLKTRVKATHKRSEFFAYGRGKYIHFVWPLQASDSKFTDPTTGLCDSEKYLASTNVRILAGKAAKDFAFSVDDTVIASLDKAGKLKFWDIRPLTSLDMNRNEAVDYCIDTPMMVFNTTQPREKSWPTSVMFIDKEKTMSKGYACRYMIIGMKQNHVIQLWDLILGKPVQEVTFPHGDESDPLLSLAYCPRSATLAVGHPLRNSIFLLHVSYPPYKYQPFNQAKFLSLLADKEKKHIPTPPSTIIIDHIQEYSVGSVPSLGELRSFDFMVGTPAEAATIPGYMNTLICMHSRGIFQYILTKPNLGLGDDGSGVRRIDGIEAGVIEVRELVQPVQEEHTATPTAKSLSDIKEVVDKDKKKKKKAEASLSSNETVSKTAPTTAIPLSTTPSTIPLSSSEFDLKEMVTGIVRTQLAEFQVYLERTRHDDHLFFANNQTEILKGVEHSLQSNLYTWRTQFEAAISKTVKAHWDRNPQLSNQHVEALLDTIPGKVQNMLLPSIQTMVGQAANVAAKDAESRYHKLFTRYEAQHQQDSHAISKLTHQINTLTAQYEAKIQQDAQSIDQLGAQLNTLTAAVTALAKLQSDMSEGRYVGAAEPQPVQAPVQHANPDFQAIQDLIDRNLVDEALMLLLRLPPDSQAPAFDQVLAKYTGNVERYLQTSNPLILLSVIATISASLETSVPARLEWIDKALDRMDLSDVNIRTHTPNIMELLLQRLQPLYNMSKANGSSMPIFTKIQSIGTKAAELMELSRMDRK
jgi:hypothetical protein